MIRKVVIPLVFLVLAITANCEEPYLGFFDAIGTDLAYRALGTAFGEPWQPEFHIVEMCFPPLSKCAPRFPLGRYLMLGLRIAQVARYFASNGECHWGWSFLVPSLAIPIIYTGREIREGIEHFLILNTRWSWWNTLGPSRLRISLEYNLVLFYQVFVGLMVGTDINYGKTSYPEPNLFIGVSFKYGWTRPEALM